MDLVIDANIVMSALINVKGKTLELIFSDRLNLFAPEFLTQEIKKYSKEIIYKSGLSESEFETFLSIIMSNINIIPFVEIKNNMKHAEKISPDPNDALYFALALNMKCSLWTNDKKLKEQETIKIFNTTELLEFFER